MQQYGQQTGGHDNTLFTEQDHNILLKFQPDNSPENEAYKTFTTRANEWAPFLPKYFGTKVIENKTYLLMENLTARFSQPCVLDIKMGKKSSAPDASEQKKEIQYKKALSTTGLSHGLRIIGMKKYDHVTKNVVTYPKSFGAGLDNMDKVRLSLTHFFSAACPHTATSEQIVNETFQQSMIEADLMQAQINRNAIQSVISQLQNLRDFMCSPPKTKFNFYSSSLLITFDGAIPNSGDVSTKMIDFQHVFEQVPESVAYGEDDGYIDGLNNLISVLQEILSQEQLLKQS
ncbi:putative Inositol hexakisphosphate kinase 3 [Blattamonas nauphoetae]|uniref:Kinase n=1 Tax=Blattamonas nauphoetae TaxID=2049346 RepID=A0ABQ9XD59_9EUKA|nr:putative Inositol hexakisphosphate kinase 3 [Blattamonas nauphoetae]